MLIKSFVNQRSKGEDVKSLEKLKKLAICDCEKSELTDEEKAKLQYLQNDYVQGKDSVVLSVEKLAQETIVAITGVSHIEENNEAIKILERFKKDNCIVCDTHIDREKLISQKISNKKSIYAKLDKEQQGVLEKVIKLVSSDDPFKIKSNLINTLSTGDISDLLYLKEEFSKTKMLLETQVLQTISTILSSTDLLQQMSKYEQLLEEKLEIHDEDLSFIVAILNSNMDKQLNLDRDENKNIVVKLENNTFLGKTRNELPLSTGEQNFLSLAFEFMKAHNSNKPIVVIDDPISSFDSIYKNKVIYALLKMLSDKRKVVLTHNTDALRLFNAQNGECYSLYLLNNSYRGNNGFVPVNQKEKKLLINLSCLVKFFRREVFSFIENEKLFLISMIPFMRGYANITQKRKWNDKLTNVMHGSMRETVDILEAYNKVFNIRNNKFSFSKFNTSVPEIFNFKIENLCILNKDNYPLLDKTLRHSFSYLYLRLLTEKTLSEKYNIKGNNKTFGAIINKAFPRNNPKMVENRIFLTSKKTLINEFNHFEGNLSIFQPAIDISDQALAKEREDIIGFLNSI